MELGKNITVWVLPYRFVGEEDLPVTSEEREYASIVAVEVFNKTRDTLVKKYRQCGLE